MNFIQEQIRLSGDNKPEIVFLGEGNPETGFINKVLSGLKGITPSNTAIFCIGGDDVEIKKVFKLLESQDNFQFVGKLGVFADAENKPAAKKDTILQAFRSVGFPSDDSLIKDYVMMENGKKAGFFISPDGASRGAIEDIILREIATSKLNGCVTAFSDCIKKIDNTDLDKKGKVQAFITAVHKKGLCGSRAAFQAGILDVNHKAYVDVVRFIKNVVS